MFRNRALNKRHIIDRSISSFTTRFSGTRIINGPDTNITNITNNSGITTFIRRLRNNFITTVRHLGMVTDNTMLTTRYLIFQHTTLNSDHLRTTLLIPSTIGRFLGFLIRLKILAFVSIINNLFRISLPNSLYKFMNQPQRRQHFRRTRTLTVNGANLIRLIFRQSRTRQRQIRYTISRRLGSITTTLHVQSTNNSIRPIITTFHTNSTTSRFTILMTRLHKFSIIRPTIVIRNLNAIPYISSLPVKRNRTFRHTPITVFNNT